MDGLPGKWSSGFNITWDLSTAVLDPGVRYSIVSEGGCRLMAVWVREEEEAS